MKRGLEHQFLRSNGEGFEPVGYRPSMSFAPNDWEPLVLRSRKEATVVSLKWHGKDLFHEREQYVNDRMLLVKMEHESRAQRRALFNIDLQGVHPSEVEAATLNLNLVPSGLGFVAYLPETVTFAVYGITDEARESWPSTEPRWEEAPGYVPEDPAAVNSAEVTLLGKFEINRGRQRGRCTIETDELRDFLRNDTSGVAGFLVVRETYGTGNYSLVHAFASSRHPEASEPSLEVTLADQE